MHAGRGLYYLIRDDRAAALEAYDAAAAASRLAPTPYLRIFWHHSALLRSLDGDPEAAEAARAEVRPRTPPDTVGGALLCYADAVAAGAPDCGTKPMPGSPWRNGNSILPAVGRNATWPTD